MVDNAKFMEKYQVPKGSLNSLAKIVLENEKKEFEKLLAVDSFESEKALYDYIFQLKNFLNYPHDHIPDAENRVNEKLYYIQTQLGKDILDKGISIYERHKSVQPMAKAMGIGERCGMEQEIMNDPELAKQLDDMRYHPEKYKNLTGKYVPYLAVYCNMVEQEINERKREKATEEKKEEETI